MPCPHLAQHRESVLRGLRFRLPAHRALLLLVPRKHTLKGLCESGNSALEAGHGLTQVAHLLLQLAAVRGVALLHARPLLQYALHALREGALQLLEHGLGARLEGRQQRALEALAEGGGQLRLDRVPYRVAHAVAHLAGDGGHQLLHDLLRHLRPQSGARLGLEVRR